MLEIDKSIFNEVFYPKPQLKWLDYKIQNNELISYRIWKLCRNTQISGDKIVKIAGNEAVILLNDRNREIINIMKEFGLTVGAYAWEYHSELDQNTYNFGFLQNNKRSKKKKQRD